MSAKTNFETLSLTSPKPLVTHVELNRPDRLNALNKLMWIEIGQCFRELHENQDCRAIVLSGENLSSISQRFSPIIFVLGSGKHFTAGIDLLDMLKAGQELAEIDEVARKGKYFEKMIKLYQDSLSSLENCDKPVIVCTHNGCVGAGVDMITAADIRYCTKDGWFQVKEVDIGMAADVGTLQRLPKVVGNQSLVRELCFTARKMKSDEARSEGLVSKVSFLI